ncbi:hypothetical protein [Rhizobium mongolense]|uniref:hypothetical protein n=1 Tax=Rhizobium mongolense TaxID=57676 RepID=UPI001428B764|nr:hypothetical protein [Rhizobium mongolense]
MSGNIPRRQTLAGQNEDGHVISWQQRDVNLLPDPILNLMAVAFRRSVYMNLMAMQDDQPNASRQMRRFVRRDEYSTFRSLAGNTPARTLSLG